MTREDASITGICVYGARQNNLKNLDVVIPADRLTVVTGVSGSGKSSLVFDTLYAEGQRRYVESLSAYARQFLERIGKPLVRDITGLCPAIAIRQRNAARNPRSTVGTITEVYDYLRLLYARVGVCRCRQCGRQVAADTVDATVARLQSLPDGARVYLSFPFRDSLLDTHDSRPTALLENLQKQGFHRLLVGELPGASLRQLPDYRPASRTDLDQAHVLVDRLVISPGMSDRLADSVEICYAQGNGVAEATVLNADKLGIVPPVMRFSARLECQYCGISYRRPEPRLFSFNNPYGACPTCQGFGNTTTIDRDLVIPNSGRTLEQGPIDPFVKPRYRRFQRLLLAFAQARKVPLDVPFAALPEAFRRQVWEGQGAFPGVRGFFRYLESKKYKMHVRIFISRYRGYARCPECEGERLCREARDVFVGGRRITQLTAATVSEAQEFFAELNLPAAQREVADKLLREIRQRLGFLTAVGLEYLTLDRLASTLSGGEAQRIQLAASLASSLVGTLYVLDEPSVGLHPRDAHRLIDILKRLRDSGNTVVVVEHEKEMIQAADHVIDLGPGAGELGGEVVHSGNQASLEANPASLTARYLSGRVKIPTPVFRRPANGRALVIRGARQHNLKDLTVRIPVGVMTCITGVSGSGKSTLVQDVLYPAVRKLKGWASEPVGEHLAVEGSEQISEVLLVDQNPIGKTPRSNPVTYLKAFDDIRKTFAATREARALNLSAGHFSFNVRGGRCETCQGSGAITVEMQFLADVELVCEECRGSRFKSRVLEATYKGKNIAEALELTVSEAIAFFKTHAALTRKLKVLQDIGLGYLRLGQSATTLSGGEAQRVKLAYYLAKSTSARPLFIFDEPTTGLHFDDIQKLLRAFDRLLAKGGTVLVVEHNLDVIRSADWVIDLGPEGGDAGGFIVAEGTPEDVAKNEQSHTGRFLRTALQG